METLLEWIYFTWRTELRCLAFQVQQFDLGAQGSAAAVGARLTFRDLDLQQSSPDSLYKKNYQLMLMVL